MHKSIVLQPLDNLMVCCGYCGLKCFGSTSKGNNEQNGVAKKICIANP